MTRDQRPHRVGRLRALLQPVVDPLGVDLHDRRLAARVVMSEDFDERAVARRARIGDDDAEERALLGSGATQTNGNHLTLLNDLRGSNPNVGFAVARLRSVRLQPARDPRSDATVRLKADTTDDEIRAPR